MPKEELKVLRDRMEKVIEHLKGEFLAIRTGRAHPGLVSDIKVDYYGAPTPIKQIATISVPEGRQIAISPFDRSALKLVEKAILASSLGVTPQNDGEIIRVNLPELTRQLELRGAIEQMYMDGDLTRRVSVSGKGEINATADSFNKLIGSYQTIIGNDTKRNAYGYKIHLIYGCTAKPSERSNATVNESPEAVTLSWELSTVSAEIAMEGFKPSAKITIDSTKVDPAKLKELEDLLYGTAASEASLPTPDAVAALIGTPATP